MVHLTTLKLNGVAHKFGRLESPYVLNFVTQFGNSDKILSFINAKIGERNVG